MRTFTIALSLKLIGVLAGMVLGRISANDWLLDRWQLTLFNTILLLLLLTPWPHLRPFRHHPHLKHAQLILTITLAILFPYLELIQAAHLEPIIDNLPIRTILGWSQEEVNSVHSLGYLFTMVPVVLASWQYGRIGLYTSMSWNGLWYSITPLLLPNNSLNLSLYDIQGFVQLGVTLILGLAITILVDATQKKQAELRQANAQLATANQQLAEQTATIEQLATSHERNRLARELHDTLAHSLSATAVQLQAVGTLMQVDTAAAANELKTAQQQIKQGLHEARRAITALRATSLEQLGLTEALRQQTQNLSQRLAIPIHCHIDKTLPPLSPLIEQTIYRIAEEALTNAEKYAQATEMHVSLRHTPSAIQLTVKDDGVGFLSEAKPNGHFNQNTHFGLIGMQERANLINATLTIDTTPHQGTQITLYKGIP